MFRIVGIVFFVVFMHSAGGQDLRSGLMVDAGYFGETLTKAGAVAAVQKSISKESDRHRLRLNVIYYRHPGYNKNLLLLPEYLFRSTGKKGLFFEISAGGGWMYQKADKTIIAYTDGIFAETNKGWSYLAPTIQLGIGKSLVKGPWSGMAFSAGLRWFGQLPFNDFMMHHLALEGRVSVPLEFFSRQ